MDTPDTRLQEAFTLIELLVVISIIALLVGILLPALGAARRSAQDLKSKSNLRQLMLAYTAYQYDHKGFVLPAYPPDSLYGNPVQVEYAGHTIDGVVGARYPWRLIPYVEDVWDMIYCHKGVPPRPEAADAQNEAYGKAYELSLYPSYGLNEVYVGGHRHFDGFTTVDGRNVPAFGRHVVFKNAEVRRPPELIVLADSQYKNAYGGLTPQAGSFHLTPPRARGENWRGVGGSFELRNETAMGVPQGRFGPNAGVSFFDGHVQGLAPEDLNDMRLWANNADAPDYDYTP